MDARYEKVKVRLQLEGHRFTYRMTRDRRGRWTGGQLGIHPCVQCWPPPPDHPSPEYQLADPETRVSKHRNVWHGIRKHLLPTVNFNRIPMICS